MNPLALQQLAALLAQQPELLAAIAQGMPVAQPVQPSPMGNITQLPPPAPNPVLTVHANAASAQPSAKQQAQAISGGAGRTPAPASTMSAGMSGSQTQLRPAPAPTTATMPYDQWSAAVDSPRGAPHFLPKPVGGV